MVSKIKKGTILGFLAGSLFILMGILTALKITPPITAVGSEVGLGIWRIFAGGVILVATKTIKKEKFSGVIIIALGIFEIFVFLIEKDYSILTIAPFIAILAGIFALLNK